MFKRYNRGICLDIREDFCSSAFISTEWVKAKNKNAYAVDIDKSALKIAHEKAKNRIPLSNIVFFTRQLATMFSAGLTLERAIQSLGSEEKHRKFKKVLKTILSFHFF